MTTIVILCMDNALPSGLMGIDDLLALSSLHFVQQSSKSDAASVEWKPNVILANNKGGPIYDGHGRTISVDSDLKSIAQCDAVLIPGFIPNQDGCAPDVMSDSNTQAWLKEQYKRGSLLCGSCSGVFALGEAGILNDRQCTTTWWLHDELHQRFPKAKAQWASELIDDRRVVTAGGPLSWVSITLYIIKKFAGIETAKVVADFSVVDAVPKSQNLYVPKGYQSSQHPFLERAEYAIRKAHYQPMTVKDLSNVMSVSERSLNRKIKELTGKTPKGFIDSIRISHACTLLVTSNKSVKDIAFSLGYSDDSVFRRLFKKQLKMTPSNYQRERKSAFS